MTTRKLAPATLLSVVAVTLAACGVGSSSHVVARHAPTTVASSSSTTVPGAAGSASPVPASTPVVGTPTTTSSALDPQTLDQVAADLGALDNSLNTADSDLNHPQGDS